MSPNKDSKQLDKKMAYRIHYTVANVTEDNTSPSAFSFSFVCCVYGELKREHIIDIQILCLEHFKKDMYPHNLKRVFTVNSTLTIVSYIPVGELVHSVVGLDPYIST